MSMKIYYPFLSCLDYHIFSFERYAYFKNNPSPNVSLRLMFCRLKATQEKQTLQLTGARRVKLI